MRIRELRKQLGLSQSQLATLVGVRQASISLWESGQAEPSIRYIKKLAIVFNCSLDELLAS